MNQNIELKIDKLLLEGFSRRELSSIRQLVITELNSIIKDRWKSEWAEQDITIIKIQTIPFNYQKSSSPEIIAKKIAHSILQTFSRNSQV